MDYNGNGYYGFIKNLQGDIVSIVPLDSESNVEVNMEYDAWGKPIFEESSLGAAFVKAMIMAAVNVGYRGYFYDFETGLYYLRSRYTMTRRLRDLLMAICIRFMFPKRIL